MDYMAAMMDDKIEGAQNEYEAMRDEIDRLRAQVEALSADAARLDHIERNARCDPKMDGNHVWWPTTFNRRLSGPTLRAAIDADREGASK